MKVELLQDPGLDSISATKFNKVIFFSAKTIKTIKTINIIKKLNNFQASWKRHEKTDLNLFYISMASMKKILFRLFNWFLISSTLACHSYLRVLKYNHGKTPQQSTNN